MDNPSKEESFLRQLTKITIAKELGLDIKPNEIKRSISRVAAALKVEPKELLDVLFPIMEEVISDILSVLRDLSREASETKKGIPGDVFMKTKPEDPSA